MSTERLDYRDSELLQFSATVVAVEGSGDRTLIETDRTAFYPTSGGQPHDTGYLGDAKVIEVADQDGRVVHIVEGESESAGQSILGRIDGARRRDHMQQHSGQHILSQAFEHAAGLRTVSFHLGTTSCTIDLDRARVSEDEIRRAERLAQSVVLDDRPILTHFTESDDLELSSRPR